jgi:predicted TIM-barrel fold metal-dependent hydrolase
MLTVKIESVKGTKLKNIFVVDAHSHLGSDVDGATMMNPLAPGSGTFDFWSKIQAKLIEDWNKNGEKSFQTNIKGENIRLTFDFAPIPFIKKVFKHLESFNKNFADINKKISYATFIDQAAVFPFQDTFRDKRPEALYRASNINISRFTTRFPFSFKLIGYCRVDPIEGEKAVNEVKYANEVLGLRGLKLHPRSEGWIDRVDSQKVINVLIEAVKHSMPIIFDTRGRQTILDIRDLTNHTRDIIKKSFPELLPHFKVLIGHCAQGNVDDYEVYEAIIQPNTFGELSMLHGSGAGNFFKSFRNWYVENNQQKITGKKWSEFLLYGSDYPYFGDVHAEKLIIYIINKQFFDSGGSIDDAENILGLNLLKLLPEYNLPQINESPIKIKSALIPNIQIGQISPKDDLPLEIGTKIIAKLLSEDIIDISKLCFQFKDSFENYNNEVLLKTIPKSSPDKAINILFMNLLKNQLSIITPLKSKIKWKKFGYKYFNPKDHELFNSILNESYPTNDINQASQIISQIFQ